MRHVPSTYTVDYTWEPDGPLGFEFRITGDIEPYDPGDYDTPPCGGGAEVTEVELVKVLTESADLDGRTYCHRKNVEQDFWAAMAADQRLCRSVEEALCVQASEAAQGAYEYAMEERFQRMRDGDL